MKIRALIGFWLVSLLGLAMCGSGLPDIGLSSSQGKLDAGLRTALQRGAGGDVGWDTVTVIFTPEAMVDAAIDTFAYPASADTADANRIRRLNNIRLGRYIHSWRGDPADIDPSHAEAVRDTAKVIRIGTGTGGRYACPTFAYSNIAKTDTNGYKVVAGAGVFVQMYSDGARLVDGTRALAMSFSTANRMAELVYIPWENHIPAGSTIVSAEVNYSMVNTATMANTDTLIAIQLSNESDDKWYRVKGLTNFPDYAHASWSHQEDTNGGAWTGTERYAWSPALDSRARFWNFGYVSDWTGTTKTSIINHQNLPVKITNCVQSVVSGGVNNGYMLVYEDYNGASTFYLGQWDDYGTTATGRTPCAVVKYITKRYQKPFGSAEFAVAIQTDDGNKYVNEAFSDSIAAVGGSYTMYVAKIQMNPADTLKLTAAQVIGVHDAGHEVGSHSTWHGFAGKGVGHWTPADTLNGASPDTMWSGLCAFVAPAWMYDMADAEGRDLRSSSRFAKSFGAPTSKLTGYGILAIERAGYESYRTLGTAATNDRERYFSPPLGVRGDTATFWAPTQYARHKRNLSLIAPTHNWSVIVGDTSLTGEDAGHLAKVSRNVWRACWQVIGNDSRLFSIFTHDVKDADLKSGAYSDGINPEEIGVIVDVVDSLGGRFMNSGDYVRALKAGGVAVDYPYAGVKADTLMQPASKRVWFKPNGIDNRWIRGVR